MKMNKVILSEKMQARFWSKVDKSPGQGPEGKCWVWLGSIAKGYGQIQIEGKNYYAHRISYFLKTGIWSEELVCHKCDFGLCST